LKSLFFRTLKVLEQEWFIQVLLGFDDGKVLKNNWNTNISSSVQDLLIMKKGHMKSIRKGLGSLEDYGEKSMGRSNQKSMS
jgi:hypothetical protein